MQKNERIIVAHIIGKWIGGGVESVIMNYYRHMDKNIIQFHFICDNDSTNIPYEEIEKLGGKVILVPPYQKLFKYNKELKKIFNKNKYKIVHSHINTLSIFPLRIAKKCEIPVRIAHSHSTTNKKEWKKNILKQMLRPFSKVFATNYFACSEHAGRWLFGNKIFNEGKVTIINNAINIEKFNFNKEIRDKIRKQLDIENKFVLGHVGRFVKQKNHKFLIEIFNEVYKVNKNAVLILIGEGPLENKIKNRIKELKIEDSVKFLGVRSDVNELMQAMDVFIFPSLYEGLGIVAIEAQCAGLQCVCSTNVPKEADMGNIKYIKNNDLNSWKEFLLKEKCDRKIKDNVKIEGYEIQKASILLENIYFNFYKKFSYKNYAIITSGFLPLPSVKGGAVESLIESILKENEKKNNVNFLVFSDYDSDAITESNKYKNTDFKYIKTNKIIKIIDYLVFKFVKNVMHKSDMQKYRFIFKRIYFLRKVSKELKINNYDKVILENHPTQYLALKWNKNHIKYSGRYYFHCHNIFNKTYGCEEIIKKTEKFLCVSNFVADKLKEYFNHEISESKIVILKNCINMEVFNQKLNEDERMKLLQKYNLNNNDNIILYVGRIIKEKGILELLNSLEYIKSKNIKLLIAGGAISKINIETEFIKKCKEKIAENKEMIVLTGYIDYSEIYKFYKLSKIAILPSIWEEPAGLTMLEATASGTPLITTMSGGISDYISANCSIVLNRDDNLEKNIAKNIDKLLNNEELRQDMAQKALYYSKNFNVTQYYNNFINILEK